MYDCKLFKPLGETLEVEFILNSLVSQTIQDFTNELTCPEKTHSSYECVHLDLLEDVLYLPHYTLAYPSQAYTCAQNKTSRHAQEGVHSQT